MKILIIGAGAWGTALAMNAAACRPGQHQVTLWARDARQAQAMAVSRVNERYLPGLPFPSGLEILHTPVQDLCAAAQNQDLVILATPMAGLRGMLQALRAKE